jgi:hypothetical protein
MPSAPDAAAAEGLPNNQTRRSFLKSIPAAAVAASVPAAAVAEPASAETNDARVDRLMRELSDALVEFMDGRFHAVIRPANEPQAIQLVSTDAARRAEALQDAEYHAEMLCQAMERSMPDGDWSFKINAEYGWVLVTDANNQWRT